MSQTIPVIHRGNPDLYFRYTPKFTLTQSNYRDSIHFHSFLSDTPIVSPFTVAVFKVKRRAA